VDRRRVVDAIFYVTATGCQWRALPACYPNWNTVHRCHLEWSRDGTWERMAERLAAAVRQKEGRLGTPSAGIVDARSVRAAATVSKKTKGYDAGNDAGWAVMPGSPPPGHIGAGRMGWCS
jgi:transposase